MSFSETDGSDGGSDGGGGAIDESEATGLDDEFGLYHFSNLSLFLVHQSSAWCSSNLFLLQNKKVFGHDL